MTARAVLTLGVAFAAGSVLCSTATFAQGVQPDIVPLNLASECTTDGVSLSGAGHTCYADNPTCQTAPEDYVIAKDKAVPVLTSANGPLSGDANRSCIVTFRDDVEVLEGTGILQPKTVCIQATAESGSGMDRVGVRGWSKCTLTGILTRFRS